MKTTKLSMQLARKIEDCEIDIKEVWNVLKNDPCAMKTVVYTWHETGYFHLVEKLCTEKYREMFEKIYNM